MKNITAIDQILLHENCDRVYRKMRRILLLQLSMLFSLLIGLYCYDVYVWTDGISYIFYTAKEQANLSKVIMDIQYTSINIKQILRQRFRRLNKEHTK